LEHEERAASRKRAKSEGAKPVKKPAKRQFKPTATISSTQINNLTKAIVDAMSNINLSKMEPEENMAPFSVFGSNGTSDVDIHDFDTESIEQLIPVRRISRPRAQSNASSSSSTRSGRNTPILQDARLKAQENVLTAAALRASSIVKKDAIENTSDDSDSNYDSDE
ncbi:unnamed protein product, partial [Aphanomyces euteiches]